MKHRPFQSSYLQEFEVVEQHQDNVRLYPHTDQLPKLLRAINNEFLTPLPPRIARVDERADGFHKSLLGLAATTFSSAVNASRSDLLRLHALPNHNLVYKVTLVQQITEDAPEGRFHRFRFFGGPDFFPEIYLSGKRLAFADHVLQRFSKRVPNNLGEDLSNFLLTFYSTPIISVKVGPGRAFVVFYRDSILAFTYKENEKEFFITTCLSTNEMSSMEFPLPPRAYNLHYGSEFTKAKHRNWIPIQHMNELHDRWLNKVPPPPPFLPAKLGEWFKIAGSLKDELIAQGHGPGSRICFLDQIPGPCCLQLCPGETELKIDERQFYKTNLPKLDWDAMYANMELENSKKQRAGQSELG